MALLAVSLLLLERTAGGEHMVYYVGNWPAPFGIVLVADHLAAIMLLVTAILAACVVLYAVRGGDLSGRYFHLLFQLQLFGLNGAFLTGDLFNLFVFFEVLLIASYGLLLLGGHVDALDLVLLGEVERQFSAFPGQLVGIDQLPELADDPCG